MELQRGIIDAIIKKCAKSENFKFLSCENSKEDIIYTGFLSLYEKKVIKYKVCESRNEIYIFIKSLPESKFQKRLVLDTGCFRREVLVYREIIDDFDDYQLPVPKCYFANADGLIVIEDLSHSGFVNKNLFVPLDLAHCELVIDALAKLHSASFIIENNNGKKLNESYPVLDSEVLLNGSDKNPAKRSFINGTKALKKVTEKYLKDFPKNAIDKAFSHMDNIFFELGSSKVHRNVLTHSDVWLNNIMFKYSDAGEVEDTRLVDFQLATYKPPSFDLQFFLNLSTTREFREVNYDRLLKRYFDTLSERLTSCSVDREEVMSWSDFQGMLQETLPQVLVVSPLYLSFILLPPSIFEEVMEDQEKFRIFFEIDRSDYVLRAMEEDGYYNQRTLQSLCELFEYFQSH